MGYHWLPTASLTHKEPDYYYCKECKTRLYDEDIEMFILKLCNECK